MKSASPPWTILALLFFSSGVECRSPVPEIKFEDLKVIAEAREENTVDLSPFDMLKDSGGKVGVFAVTGLRDLDDAHETFMADAPGCLRARKASLGLPTLPMFDGSKRTTFATETGEFPSCLSTISRLSKAFDLVEDAVSKTIQKMCGQPLEYVTGDRKVSLDDAPVKEHVHVYESSTAATGTDVMVPYHTDNGIFLVLSPFPGHGLDVELSDGRRVSTNGVGPGSLLVLMGRGLTEWLLQGGAYLASNRLFHSVPHSVPSMAAAAGTGTVAAARSVYARMKVAETDAVPFTLANIVRNRRYKTFQDVFSEANKTSDALCHAQSEVLRSFWVRSADDMCDEGTAYCWMTCMDLPSECPTPEQAVCRNDQGECDPSGHGGHSCTLQCR